MDGAHAHSILAHGAGEDQQPRPPHKSADIYSQGVNAVVAAVLAGSLSKEKARQACQGAAGRPARILNGRILLKVKKRHPAASGAGGLCPAKAQAREKAANSSCEAAGRSTFRAEKRNFPEGSGSFFEQWPMTGRHRLLK
jgi:hypothetical protein